MDYTNHWDRALALRQRAHYLNHLLMKHYNRWGYESKIKALKRERNDLLTQADKIEREANVDEVGYPEKEVD